MHQLYRYHVSEGSRRKVKCNVQVAPRLSGYHDNVVLGHIRRELIDVAPVSGFLCGDDDFRGQDLQRADISRESRGWSVWTQEQHSLDAWLETGYVELMQR